MNTHTERPARLADGKTYCSCGRPWPCPHAAPDAPVSVILAGWREAEQAATKGPWRAVAGLWATDGDKKEIFPAVISSNGDPAKAETWLLAAGRGSPNPGSNAGFTAVARTAMPLLLAAVEALTSALERHREYFTDSKGVTRCGGCLEPGPCPDDPQAILAAALAGEEAGSDG